MKFTLIEDIAVTMASRPVPVDQLMIAALFGGAIGDMTPYDQNKVYAKNEKIIYYTADGKLNILTAKKDGVTGEFNIDSWQLFNLMSGSGAGGSGNALSDVKLVSSLDNSVIDSIMNI